MTKFATRCVHAGHFDDGFGSVNVPLQLSTTFRQPAPNEPLRYDYSRGGNPTREAFENALAELEGGATGHAFASGLSALDALLRTLDAGDHVIAAEDGYGGSIRLLRQVAARQGIRTTFVDTRDEAALEAAFEERTKLVILETPSNPLLRVTDIKAVARLCNKGGARLVVDNTFMSPALQNPLALGADAVFHSATKYIGGHSDVLAGAVVCKDKELGDQVRFLQMAVGAVASPFDSYLLLRGLRTLALRMERHAGNAHAVATALVDERGVEAVFYPGLATDAGYTIQGKQARSGGGMVSFRVKDKARAAAIAKRTGIFQLAESLGAVESLIQVPALMTHASVPAEMRRRTGLADGLIRLSVGIEDAEDLVSDLKTALRS